MEKIVQSSSDTFETEQNKLIMHVYTVLSLLYICISYIQLKLCYF